MLPLRNLKRFFSKAVRQPTYALSVGFKRLWALLAYFLGGGKSTSPEALTFFLTKLCNLSCRMCGQWGDYGITKQEGAGDLKFQLSLDEIKIVLDDVCRFKPNITLFGGEPLLYPQIMDVINHIKKLNLHCLIITNGTLLASFAKSLVEAGLDELNISIDGDRELHDEIRGFPGVFDKIMEGIEEVNQWKRRLSRNKPLMINIQCTINRYNYERLEALLDVAQKAQANSLTFHHLVFLTKDLMEKQKPFDKLLTCSSRDWEGFIFEPGIDPQKLYKKLEEILRLKHRFCVDYYPNFSKKMIEEYYKNPDYLPSEYPPRCVSPWICAYIFPNVDVRPCLNCTYSFGNIREAEFLKIWNSPKAILYRKTLKKEGIFPVCRRCTELYRY